MSRSSRRMPDRIPCSDCGAGLVRQDHRALTAQAICGAPVLMSFSAPPFTTHFSTLASAYDVVLCDVWGVVHNSVVAFTDACAALAEFRRRNGTVVLVTNTPLPSAGR